MRIVAAGRSGPANATRAIRPAGGDHMQSERFDAVVKQAAAASRRQILGVALGGVLAAFGGTTAAAACGKGCKRSRCKRCKHGRCRPLKDGRACGADRVCLFRTCLLAGTCSSPFDYCDPTSFTPCGPPENDCRCFSTVSGSSICATVTATCNDCTSDADCRPGEACAPVPCGCTVGNGNGCVTGCPAKPEINREI